MNDQVVDDLSVRNSSEPMDGQSLVNWLIREHRETCCPITPIPEQLVERARMLIDAGADVNGRADDGTTALIWAAMHGSEGLVRVLLTAGADVNASTRSGTTALTQAVRHGFEEIARLLLAAGADVDARGKEGPLQDRRTALSYAAGCGSEELVRMLIAAGADVNAGDESASTPLMKASEREGLAVVRLLLAVGADVNARDDAGNTALMRAVVMRRSEALQALIASGVIVDATAEDGMAARMWAYGDDLIGIVEELLDAEEAAIEAQSTGLVVPTRDIHADEVLLKAEEGRSLELVQVLLAAGADVNVTNRDGLSAISWAIWQGQPEIVQVLIAAGAGGRDACRS